MTPSILWLISSSINFMDTIGVRVRFILVKTMSFNAGGIILPLMTAVFLHESHKNTVQQVAIL